MISEEAFDGIIKKSQKYKHSSMNYIDYEDCENAEILFEREDLILLQDKTKAPSMLYFAADNFETILEVIADMKGDMRLHFVPREYAPQLGKLGFIEWCEFVDFFNYNLNETLALFDNRSEREYLRAEECEEASLVSQKCRLQSRGFEGESKEWFADWITENKVIILRKDSEIIAFCCVSIYNKGTTLWIRMIAVLPALQGTGIGKKLMEQAISYGVENGAVKGFLGADVLNNNAIRLYEKHGFHAKDSDGELRMVRH